MIGENSLSLQSVRDSQDSGSAIPHTNFNHTDLKMNQPNDLTPLIIEGIRQRKGRNITLIDMSGIETAATPRFIICEGTSSQQVGAIADSVRDYLLEQEGVKPYNYDGYGNSTWIVVDYGDTLVHVFHPETRRHYNLEELWADGKITELPDED